MGDGSETFLLALENNTVLYLANKKGVHLGMMSNNKFSFLFLYGKNLTEQVALFYFILFYRVPSIDYQN